VKAGFFSGAERIKMPLLPPGAALCGVRAPILAVAPDEHAVFDFPLASVHDDPAGEVMAVEKRFRLRPAARR